MLSPVETPADLTARAHYERQQRLAVQASSAASEAWRSIDVDDIAASWAVRVPQVVHEVRVAQRAAASLADGYVADALEVMGADVAPAGRVVPTALAQTASDGRPLSSLFVQPAFSTLTSIAAGVDVGDAVEVGLGALTRMVATQVVDAGRVADGIAVAARPTVGYVRMLAPPSCSRCAVLAGRHYRWNAGFLRHPRCDCRHIPVAESVRGDVTVDARRYFDSLTNAQQDDIFTAAGARAIRDGADIGKVVNARRGMDIAGNRGPRSARTATREAAGRSVRLTPEGIYTRARGDRDLALSLLREHGYLA